MLYQAYKDSELHFEAFNLEELHNKILNAEYETLPGFHIVALNDDGENVAFDDREFLAGLAAAFDESVVSAHWDREHYSSQRGC